MTHTNNHLDFCLPSDITAEKFLAEYWQKKPLLIKNGLPNLVGQLEPEDVFELAYADDVTARLLVQDNNNPKNWNLSLSPFEDEQLEETAQTHKHWTVLVQNLEQWSLDIAQLWQHFSFLPQWQQDDIMVSYAPAGGSVGEHYDEYDVFLAQGYGKRRWQLGKWCDENTDIQPNQPLKLIDDMGEIILDEVLEPGDVLYVPPRLSHYGVAVDDSLTFSFGLRRPSMVEVLDNLVDSINGEQSATRMPNLKRPLTEPQYDQSQAAVHVQDNGGIPAINLAHIKQQLIKSLHTDKLDSLLTDALAKAVSERRFGLLETEEQVSADEVQEMLAEGEVIQKEPAARILYVERDGETQFYCQGEQQCIDTAFTGVFKQLADNLSLSYDDIEELIQNAVDDDISEDVLDEYIAQLLEIFSEWLGEGWLIFN